MGGGTWGQHGFVRNRSCFTTLLAYLEEVTECHDSGYPVDVNYLDFQKAFDKVPDCRLIHKLKAHCIGGNLLKWIENWLINRKQMVIIKCQLSEWRHILSGVPQGQLLAHCYL